MSLRLRTRRAVRRRVAAASVVLPPGQGPEPWQALVARAQLAEARRRLRADRDVAAALQLALPQLAGPAASGAWALVADAREAAGDRSGALTAVRRAAEADPGFDARALHHRLAHADGNGAEAALALARLLDTRPRNRRQALALVEAVRSGGHEDVRSLRGNLDRWGLTGYDEHLAEAYAEIDLRSVPADALVCDVARVSRLLAQPLATVARALDQRRAWADLAAYADARSAPVAVPRRREAALELRRAASRALSAGYTGPAQRLAAHALSLHPGDRYAQDTWANATDQLRVIRDGWSAPKPAPRPRYQPRPRAVLSVLAQSLPHTSGGYATRSHGVLTGLRDLDWDVEAVTRLGFPYDRWPQADPRVAGPADEVDGIRYHRVLEEGQRKYPQHPLTSYVDRFAASLEHHARRHRPALLHASSFHVNGLATRQAAARLGVPYVYEMRGLEELMKLSRDPAFGSSDRARFLETVELASCAGAARVFVITDALRRHMASLGVPEEKLVVLPNGVHASRFEPRPRDPDLEASLGVAGKTVIGYAGGLVDYEGLELLLTAVAALRARRTDFHVVVVGDGPHQAAVHRAAERLEDVVTFTGRVPHEEVARYLSLFDITPFPRLPLPVCELISPIKPFESMAMGRAVVVSSVAALTEIVRDGDTGLVFEKGSSASLSRVLERLLDDPELVAKLGESARTWVRGERDWSSIVEVVSESYEDLLTHPVDKVY